jgi:hypothetical protein
MYDGACETPAANDACAQIGEACGAAGQSFDVPGCKGTLKVFNKTNIELIPECMNDQDPNLDCQMAFDACIDLALTP